MKPRIPAPPPLYVSRWFNTPQPLTLDVLQGRVVAIHSFQMLCPGCVAHGLPQAVKLRESFDESQLVVIGLHTVFEHHEVMGAKALEVFIHEYRLQFPIGVDEAAEHGPVPKTMAAWGLQGTPNLLLLDRQGQVRLNHFGRIDDMALGAMIGQLLAQPPPTPSATCATPTTPATVGAQSGDSCCDGEACALDLQLLKRKEKLA
jgi:hypothetical protein